MQLGLTLGVLESIGSTTKKQTVEAYVTPIELWKKRVAMCLLWD